MTLMTQKQHPDFINGVTSKLITKSKEMPAWDPSWKNRWTEPEAKKTINAFFKPYVEGSVSHARKLLGLDLEPTFYEYPHRTLSGLPSNRDIARLMNGSFFLEFVLIVGLLPKKEGRYTAEDIMNWYGRINSPPGLNSTGLNTMPKP